MLHFVYALFCTLALLLAGCDAPDRHKNEPVMNHQAAKSNTSLVATDSASAPANDAPPLVSSIRIAAISNLKIALPILIADFNHSYPNIKIEAIFAPNNVLFEQVSHHRGKFDIYLAGNDAFPKALAAKYADSGVTKPFTYTHGQLVLYSRHHAIDVSPTTTLDELLLDNKAFKLAVSSPQHAGYGMAAENWLLNQNLLNAIKPNIVYTDNIDETFAMTDEGNVDFGFVSLSQVLNKPTNNSLQGINNRQTHYAILPKDSYPPILQDGVILNQPEVSAKFVAYLKTAKAQDVLTESGFLPICTASTLLPACK